MSVRRALRPACLPLALGPLLLSTAALPGCGGKGEAADTSAEEADADADSDADADADADADGDVEPALVLNEFLSDSDSISEFIEIYNGLDSAQDLSGWSITDGYATGLTPFPFPSGTVVEAGDYLVVWADDGVGSEPGLHADFKLKKDGEIVTLLDASATVFEEVSVPALGLDQTFSRLPDGGDWAIVDGSTPGGPNPS